MTRYTFDRFAATRLYSPVVQYSPDGKRIAYIDNTTGQFNLWTMPSGGGYPRQLTTFTDNTVRSLAWSPDSRQILFNADHDGDEFHQLYLVDAQHGWPEQLTNKLDAQHHVTGNTFSPDGHPVVYAANDRNSADMDVVLRDLRTGETKRPLPPEANYFPAEWSPDGCYVTAINFKSNVDQDILLLDVRTDEITNVTPHEGQTQFFPGPWARDGSGFYLFTNYQREFNGLAFYSLADKRWDWVETPEHDVEFGALSHNGEALVWVVNENGSSKLRGRDLKRNVELKMPDLPLGVVVALDVSPDGRRAAFILSTPTEAPNLYEVDLQSGQLQALGQSMLGGIDPADMIQPELVHYPAFDGRMIPAWLYRPKGEGPFPAVLSIHGGPEAQERPRYHYQGLYQYLLNRGFAVLAPNIRGSSGYGISYQKLIHRDWGGAELKDIEHAAKYLQGLKWVDRSRIAVFGGSFGGFATLSAMTRLPDYWAVGVDLVGPSNLITFTNSVPPFWKRMMKEWVGDPEEDHDLLVERSPITYVDNVRVPMLVIQGAKDPRVVKAESDQMVERIRARGGDVRYYVDEHEGHGTTRRENAIKWMKMVAEYLEEYLLDEPV